MRLWKYYEYRYPWRLKQVCTGPERDFDKRKRVVEAVACGVDGLAAIDIMLHAWITQGRYIETGVCPQL